MTIPSFGGMTIEVLTMLVVPVLHCVVEEFKLKAGSCKKIVEINV
jgi:Cu(I)/Ag(I) efflux system membrane protein CusA/SilA